MKDSAKKAVTREISRKSLSWSSGGDMRRQSGGSDMFSGPPPQLRFISGEESIAEETSNELAKMKDESSKFVETGHSRESDSDSSKPFWRKDSSGANLSGVSFTGTSGNESLGDTNNGDQVDNRDTEATDPNNKNITSDDSKTTNDADAGFLDASDRSDRLRAQKRSLEERLNTSLKGAANFDASEKGDEVEGSNEHERMKKQLLDSHSKLTQPPLQECAVTTPASDIPTSGGEVQTPKAGNDDDRPQ